MKKKKNKTEAEAVETVENSTESAQDTEGSKEIKTEDKTESSEESKTEDKAESNEQAEDAAGDSNTEDSYNPEDYEYDEEGEIVRKKKKKKKPKDRKPEEVNIVKELLGLIIYIGFVILVCFLIITFIGCKSRVDGDSMNPTLEDGDQLWVSKIAYTIGKPHRFDVIIFKYDEDDTYVKRIIALPGERIRIDNEGNIYINDLLIEEHYGKEPIMANNVGRAGQDVLLGEDEYFVLGDNRNNSHDSRWADVGNVQKEDIIGKVSFRMYPFSKFGKVK